MRLLVYIRLFICMFVGTIPAYSFENTTLPDSVIQELEKIEGDSLKVIYLVHFSTENRIIGKYDLALSSIIYAFNIQRGMNNPYLKGSVMHVFGLTYSSMDQFDKAKSYYFKALNSYIISRNKEKIGLVYNSIGVLFKNNVDYDQAIEYLKISSKVLEDAESQFVWIPISNLGIVYKSLGNYLLSLHYYKKSMENNDNISPNIFGNLGVLYMYLKSYDNSKRYLNKSLKEYQKIKKIKFEWKVLNCLANIYIREKRYDSAKIYIDELFRLSTAIDLKFITGATHLTVARYFISTKNIYEAESNLSLALSSYEDKDDVNFEAESKLLKAELYQNKGLLDQALEIAKDALILINENEIYSLRNEGYDILSNVYLKTGDYKKGYELLSMINHEQDSISNVYMSLTYQAQLDLEKQWIKSEYTNTLKLNDKLVAKNSTLILYLRILSVIVTLFFTLLIIFITKFRLAQTNNYYLNKKVLILKKSRPYISKNRILSVVKGTK